MTELATLLVSSDNPAANATQARHLPDHRVPAPAALRSIRAQTPGLPPLVLLACARVCVRVCVHVALLGLLI